MSDSLPTALRVVHGPEDARAQRSAVRQVLHLWQTLRRRWQTFGMVCVLVGLLGGFYYLTAKRLYRSEASLLVTIPGTDDRSRTAMSGHDSQMPTFQRLCKSNVVLDGALSRIGKADPELLVDFRSVPKDRQREKLDQLITVRNARHTNVLDLACDSRSPAAASMILSSLIDSYLDFVATHHRDVSVEIVEGLDKERAEYERQYLLKQQEVISKRKAAGDLGIRDGSRMMHPVVQRVVSLNDDLMEVQKERLRLESSFAAIQAGVSRGGDLTRYLSAVDPELGNRLLARTLGIDSEGGDRIAPIERQLLDDRSRLEMILPHYGDRNPEVVQIRGRIAQAEEFLKFHTDRMQHAIDRIGQEQLAELLLGNIGEQLSKVRAHESRLREQYLQEEKAAVAMNDRIATLQLAEMELKRLGQLHENLLNRIANLDIEEGQGSVRVAVVGAPTTANDPVSPRLGRTGLMSIGLAIVLGVSLVWFLDLLEDRFRSPEELTDQLGVTILSGIQHLPDQQGIGAEGILMAHSPRAPEGEAFRTLRTHISFSESETDLLAFTSAQPSDGKTTIVSNLGVAFSLSGKRTLVIDADMRKPGMSKLFGVRGQAGLSDLLRSNESIDDAVTSRLHPTGIDNLDLLPCGPKPPDPLELLNSSRLSDLIGYADSQYDQVIIDCPPMVAGTDAGVIGRSVDGLVLVIQPMKNHRRQLIRVVESIRRLRVSLLGVVLNRIPEKTNAGYDYGMGYGDGYGYGLDDTDPNVEPHPVSASIATAAGEVPEVDLAAIERHLKAG